MAESDQNESSWTDLEGDLPSLASRAAIELDNMILGNADDLAVVRRLARLLAESLEAVPDPASPESLVDPATVLVMNSAILDAHVADRPLQTLRDLVSESMRIRETLESISGLTPKADLERMRSFCVALSNRASECLKPWEELESRHPFRS